MCTVKEVTKKKQTIDIDLEEFSDEIEQWMIDDLKSIGCDTARSVLALSRDELVRPYRPSRRKWWTISSRILKTELKKPGAEEVEVKADTVEAAAP